MIEKLTVIEKLTEVAVNVVNRWHELATTSHYQTAVAVRDELLQGDREEAIDGIEELIKALSRSDRRELSSQVTRLLVHIIKWKSQPARRTRSWAVSIANARAEIEELLDFEPSLRPALESLVSDLFDKSRRLAEKEMGRKSTTFSLTWQEIFEDEYDLD